MRWLVGSLSLVMVVAACGGEAVIAPPLGTGGSGSGTGAGTGTGTGTNVAVSSGSLTGTMSSGTGVASCEQMNQAYRQLVNEARSCTSGIDIPQCKSRVPDDLYCPCETWIDGGNEQAVQALFEIADAFVDQGCLNPPPDCPPVACQLLLDSACANDVCIDASGG